MILIVGALGLVVNLLGLLLFAEHGHSHGGAGGHGHSHGASGNYKDYLSSSWFHKWAQKVKPAEVPEIPIWRRL